VKLRVLSLLCVALLIVSMNFNFAFSKDDIISVGKVSLISGIVEKLNPESKEWSKISFNDTINVGDRIRVDNSSKLEICYNDGNILRVGQGSELEVALETIKLFNGQTWFRIVKVGNKFEVVAPTFVAGVRGTVFSVKVSNNPANKKSSGGVKVWDGTVETKNEKKTQFVSEGFETAISEDLSMSAPATFDVNATGDFAEKSWQVADSEAAYKRYITLLFSGIDPNEANTNPAIRKQIEIRKKLPEVTEAYNTYKNFADMQAIENATR